MIKVVFVSLSIFVPISSSAPVLCVSMCLYCTVKTCRPSDKKHKEHVLKNISISYIGSFLLCELIQRKEEFILDSVVLEIYSGLNETRFCHFWAIRVPINYLKISTSRPKTRFTIIMVLFWDHDLNIFRKLIMPQLMFILKISEWENG